jgi:UDP-glucose 4-epimerase
MRTLAISGATGFIGRRLAAAALQRGWAVRALVRDPTRVRAAHRLDVRSWDASVPAAASDLLRGVDVVCHLAAFIPPDHDDPGFAATCFRINVQGTLALLAAAREADVPRFVHFSSANAYAAGVDLASEDHPLYPAQRAPYYLTSKMSSEVVTEYWRQAKNLSSCVLRLASVYGPGMPPRTLVPTLARRLLAGEPVVLRDGGRYATDLVYVDDVVGAALTASASQVEGPINIGSGALTTSVELTQSLLALTGADPDLVTIEPESARPDLGFVGLNVARARAWLDFDPTPLRDGLQHYIGWLANAADVSGGGRPLSASAKPSPEVPA